MARNLEAGTHHSPLPPSPNGLSGQTQNRMKNFSNFKTVTFILVLIKQKFISKYEEFAYLDYWLLEKGEVTINTIFLSVYGNF
jgi:hypothetical protein